MNWLRRKWCEWSHVHSWKGLRAFEAIDERAPIVIEMHCLKCKRFWLSHSIG